MKRTREENNKAFMVAMGQNIDRIRYEKRMTKTALAKACGFTPTKMSKICLGRNEVRVGDVARLAKALKVSCGSLFDFKHDEYL
jgi:transcriptional regulator with XRE-family HTH domain